MSAVAGLVIDPVTPATDAREGWARQDRPVVAVVGLSRRSGVTMVARALGAELALRDPDGASIVTAASASGRGIPLGTPAAGRLARAVARAVPNRARATGRICLCEVATADVGRLTRAVRDVAPLVIDVADPADAATAVSLADAALLVGVPSTEPALATVLSAALARVGPEPIVVLNRDLEGAACWKGYVAVRLPEARLGAQLAMTGREPLGALGRGIAGLADGIADAP